MAKKKMVYAFGADLTELEKGLKQINTKINKLTNTMRKNGRAMTTAFTVPLSAIGAAATKSALDVDRAMSSIARGTGATGAALKGLQTEWKSLAGSVSQNFETSAKVLADYNTRLGLTGKALKDLSKQALDAGRMLGEDVNAVVKESAKAMQDWGVPAEEMTGYMDKIFLASQSTGVGMAELSGNMYKYGSALRQMGFSTNDTIATLAQFDKQGVNTELVMGSLRIALGKLAKAGVTDAAEGFRILTDQIKNAANPTEATRKAIELFGSRAGPDMAAAIREGRFEIGELSAALMESKGAIERNSAATKTFGDRWLETKNQVGIAIAPIGKQLLNLADSVMPSVKAQAEKLGTAIENMSEDSRKAIIALAAAFAVGGPLLIAISATIKAFSTLSGTLLSLATGPAAPFIVLGVAIALIVGHFNDAEKAARDFNNEVSQIDTSKIKELQSITNAGIFGAEGLKGSIAIANEGLKKLYPPVTPKEGAAPVADVPVASPVAPPARRTGGGSIPSTGGSNGKSGPSAADKLVASIRDQMQYMNEEGAKFLPILDEWKAKLKPLSDDWKSIVDLQKQITGDVEAKSKEAITKQAEQDQKAIQDLQSMLGELNWQNSMGLLGDDEYLAHLTETFAALKSQLADPMIMETWTEPMKELFASIQQLQSAEADESMEALRMQFEAGAIGLEQYRAGLEALKTEFQEFPLAVKLIDNQIVALDRSVQNTTKSIGIMIKEAEQAIADKLSTLADDLSGAFAAALVYGDDLGAALQKLGQDIAFAIVKALLLKYVFGPIMGFMGLADGGVVSGGSIVPFARGGIVNKPTLFPMAHGMGLMGEAGPEAVMPLKRGADGKLGVTAEGSAGGSPVIINVLDQGDLERVTYEAMAKYPGSQIVTNHVMRARSERSSLAFGGV